MAIVACEGTVESGEEEGETTPEIAAVDADADGHFDSNPCNDEGEAIHPDLPLIPI